MRSRIFRTILTFVTPLIIDYIIKRITGKRKSNSIAKQISSRH